MTRSSVRRIALVKCARAAGVTGSPGRAYVSGFISGLTDKDAWADGWAGANNAASRALETVARVPTFGQANPVSSWVSRQRMPYRDSSLSGTYGRVMEHIGDMTGAAMSFGLGRLGLNRLGLAGGRAPVQATASSTGAGRVAAGLIPAQAYFTPYDTAYSTLSPYAAEAADSLADRIDSLPR